MKPLRPKRYFVRRLDERDATPPADAECEVQILNAEYQAEVIAYIARDSRRIVSLIDAVRGRLPIEGDAIPEAVINAACRMVPGPGEYVDENGETLRPAFLPPAT
jgi:hypothetical protein